MDRAGCAIFVQPVRVDVPRPKRSNSRPCWPMKVLVEPFDRRHRAVFDAVAEVEQLLRRYLEAVESLLKLSFLFAV